MLQYPPSGNSPEFRESAPYGVADLTGPEIESLLELVCYESPTYHPSRTETTYRLPGDPPSLMSVDELPGERLPDGAEVVADEGWNFIEHELADAVSADPGRTEPVVYYLANSQFANSRAAAANALPDMLYALTSGSENEDGSTRASRPGVLRAAKQLIGLVRDQDEVVYDAARYALYNLHMSDVRNHIFGTMMLDLLIDAVSGQPHYEASMRRTMGHGDRT